MSELFPAYAGVIPSIPSCKPSWPAFPRIRGGDPTAAYPGSTDPKLFPAHAGVIPDRLMPMPARRTFPRIRGGDPPEYALRAKGKVFSPHTRG